MKKIVHEFKEFAIKGNVIDLAVGVIIGAAFGKIVSSIVDDLFMPLIGILVGGVNFAKLKWVVSIPGRDSITLAYGQFLQNIVDFLIVAGVLFLFIRLLNRFNKKEAEKKPATPPADIKLLTEIRDLLKKQAKTSHKK